MGKSNAFKSTVSGYIIKVDKDKEFIDKTDSGLHIVTRFDNQSHVRQYAEVVATNNHSDVKVGDTIIFHFNVIAYSFTNKKMTHSNFYIKSDDENYDYYHVPEGMVHARITKDGGDIVTMNGFCFIKPYKKKEVVSKSGIVISQAAKVDGRDSDTKTEITHINNHEELNAGDIVFLPTYSNYEIVLKEMTVWCVDSKIILAKYYED